MARPLRLEFPGALYHITARGNAQQPIFLDDRDRQQFTRLLGHEVQQQRWRCYVYCLMGNHYHLVIETPEPNLSRGLRRLHGTFTQWFNRCHQRVGLLLQGRFKSLLVEKESYLQELWRYVVLNSVRAGMVSEAHGWAWSSYRATAGLQKAPDWLDVSAVLSLFDRHRATARIAYRRFVTEGDPPAFAVEGSAMPNLSWQPRFPRMPRTTHARKAADQCSRSPNLPNPPLSRRSPRARRLHLSAAGACRPRSVISRSLSGRCILAAARGE